MKIRLFLLCLLAQFVAFAYAQQPEAAKVAKQENLTYSRPSLSLIKITGFKNTQYADLLVDYFSKSEKFDFNIINTKSVQGNNDLHSVLMSENVGKQVLFHWLHFDGKGFNSDVLEARSMYNATDQDIILDASKKIADLKYQGRSLMDNSYVMALNLSDLSERHNKKGEITGYSAVVETKVFKVDFNDELLTSVWDNWIDASDTTLTQAEIDKKATFFNNLNVNLDSIAAVSVSGFGATPEEAVADARDEVFHALEKKIDKWEVVSTIYQKNPISAKIGSKEGLKNSQRFRAFKIVEDENGQVTQKGLGYLRVAKVAKNTAVATGETEELSTFYQISGGKLREGMYLKQKNDARMGVSASYNFGRHMTDKTGFSMAELTIDYLLHTSQSGVMQYTFLTIGYDEASCEIEGYEYKGNMLQCSLGYGVGIHPIRPVEIMPYAFIGGDYNLKGADESYDNEESFAKKLGYFVGGGAKISFMVAYPVQLFVKADYTYLFSAGEQYINPRKNSDKVDKGHGFSLSAGFRVAF